MIAKKNDDPMHLTTKHETPIDWPELAKWIARDQARVLGDDTDFDTYIVWFCFILGGWKALCSTTRADGRYYEVTYNAAKGEAYVDTYLKTHNIIVRVDTDD